jgi:hypothetical protein
VKLVILVRLHKSDSRSTTKRVVIEFRERDPNNPTISCESTSSPTLEWRSATDVTDLNIPAELVYDVVPSFITAREHHIWLLYSESECCFGLSA